MLRILILILLSTNLHSFEVPKELQCQKNSQGQYEENLHVLGEPKENFLQAMGGGCLFGDVQELWKSLRTAEVLKWEGVDEVILKMRDDFDPAQLDYKIESNYKVDHAFPVKWKMEWLHKVLLGQLESPQKVMVTYSKVAGTKFIKHWAGFIALRQVEPGVSEFIMLNQVKAQRTDLEDAKSTISDFYHRMKNYF